MLRAFKERERKAGRYYSYRPPQKVDPSYLVNPLEWRDRSPPVLRGEEADPGEVWHQGKTEIDVARLPPSNLTVSVAAPVAVSFCGPDDLHGTPSKPYAHYILYLSFTIKGRHANPPTPPHYLPPPPPLLLCRHGQMMGHEILEEGGVDGDDGYNGGG